MENRSFGRIGRDVGVVGLGAWQLGADWGEVSEDDALATLAAAVDAGVTFIDTADVYGDGRSEQLIGQLPARATRHRAHRGHQDGPPGRRRSRPTTPLDNFRGLDRPVPRQPRRGHARPGAAALPADRRCSPPTPSSTRWTPWCTRSGSPRTASAWRRVDQALTAIARPARRQRADHPERVPAQAARAGAAGRGRGRRRHHRPGAAGQRPALRPVRRATPRSPADDHRNYNRHGEAFDVGETFSGVDFATGLEAVAGCARSCRAGATMAQFALRWVIDQPGVTVVIPGARNPEQARGQRRRRRPRRRWPPESTGDGRPRTSTTS